MHYHYDHGYNRSREGRENALLGTLHADALDPKDITRLAEQVGALLDQG